MSSLSCVHGFVLESRTDGRKGRSGIPAFPTDLKSLAKKAADGSQFADLLSHHLVVTGSEGSAKDMDRPATGEEIASSLRGADRGGFAPSSKTGTGEFVRNLSLSRLCHLSFLGSQSDTEFSAFALYWQKDEATKSTSTMTLCMDRL